jgi:hypothetical protein
MSEEMNKSKLLERMHAGHTAFKATLAELSDEQMIEAGVSGGWSVKDILAHIVVHEQRMTCWLEKRLNGIALQAPQPYGMLEDDLAEVNEQIYLENRDRPLAKVLSELDEAWLQALAVVREGSAEDLNSVRLRLEGGEPLWEAVAANTFWHYEEHSRDIHAWLERQQAASAISLYGGEIQ